jgi:hypothetical protein
MPRFTILWRRAIPIVLLVTLPACGLRTSRYTTSNLANTDADGIYTNARGTLSANNGAGDVSCSVANLTRNGDVTTFATGNGIVNSQADFNTVLGLTGFTKVVNQINWCGVIAPNWIGCSPQPGTSMVVVRHSANEEGILWAHEYGHTRGVSHRDDGDAIMNPTITSAHTKVSQTECDNFRQ